MAKPLVCLVTQSADTIQSLGEFKDELNRNLHWNGKVDLTPFAANDDLTKLKGKAEDAVRAAHDRIKNDQQAAVVITGGTKATQYAQDYAAYEQWTDIVPIIQPIGGAKPDNLQVNVTGFVIEVQDTAQNQLDLITVQNVTILFEPDHQDIYDNLAANGKNLTALNKGLGDLDEMKLTDGFMIIPNATFYNKPEVIAGFVDGKKGKNTHQPMQIFYPHREFKKKHHTLAGVKVLGHNVTLTYRLAASYVDNILTTGPNFDMHNLPQFKPAIADEG